MAVLNTVRFMRVRYDSAGRVLIAWHKFANSVHSLPNAQTLAMKRKLCSKALGTA